MGLVYGMVRQWCNKILHHCWPDSGNAMPQPLRRTLVRAVFESAVCSYLNSPDLFCGTSVRRK
jgi:hypothetical protein